MKFTRKSLFYAKLAHVDGYSAIPIIADNEEQAEQFMKQIMNDNPFRYCDEVFCGIEHKFSNVIVPVKEYKFGEEDSD